MPLYNYICPSCHKEWENCRPINDRMNEKCSCGDGAVIRISTISKPVIHEYYSLSLGQRITGAKHKKEVMKKLSVEEAG